MKRLLPCLALAAAAGASCTLDLGGLPGGNATSSGSGGAANSTTVSASSAASSGGEGGEGGAQTTTAASGSSSTGTVGSVWTRRRKLMLDSGVNATLTGFPLLVLLKKAQIDFTKTQDGGQDLRFTDDQNQILDYEIERWSETDPDPSVVWVRIPSLPGKSSSNNPIIWMYYGNAQAQADQHVTAVWSNEYAGVWHLSQDDNGLVDSTGKTAKAMNNGSKRVAGMIGDARGFSASNKQFIDTLNNAQLNRFTVETWVKSNHDPTMSNGPNGPLMREKNYQIVWDHAMPYIAGASFDPKDPNNGNNTSNWQSAAFDKLDNTKWFYLAATFDGNKFITYKDGVHKHEVDMATTDPQMETVSAKIGCHAYNTMDPVNFFDGMIDEVRLSDQARSSDWIEAQNKSMRNDGFVTFGAEEIGTYPLP
jgi:hypothetical protein